jgi:predicted enzyme related to lactoylglutathione lyase
MSEGQKPETGSIVWTDLTVPDAENVRDFYSAVVGWKPEPVDMGEYADFNMCSPESGTPAVGVCHARGGNAGLPAQWLIYITVEDVNASVAACRERGGKVLMEPKSMGAHGTYCVIEDPAGAVAALIAPPKESDA